MIMIDHAACMRDLRGYYGMPRRSAIAKLSVLNFSCTARTVELVTREVPDLHPEVQPHKRHSLSKCQICKLG